MDSVLETITKGSSSRTKCEQAPSEENRCQLENFLTSTLFPLTTLLSHHGVVLQSLKPILIKANSLVSVDAYIQAKEQEIALLQKDLQGCQNSLTLVLSHSQSTVPKYFYDELTDEIMREPLTDGKYTLDSETWQKCFDANAIHPFTQMPLDLASLKEVEWKHELDKYHEMQSSKRALLQ